MGIKRGMLKHVAVKMTDAPVTITSPGSAIAVTALSTAFDLGVDKKYTSVRAIFPFVKAGNGSVTVQMEIQSSTSSGGTYADVGVQLPATTNIDPTTAALCVDAGHGYVATTGNAVATSYCDLINANRYLKVLITANFSAVTTPTVIGPIILVFEGSRDEPITNTGMLTTA
jgi:hypothetical protein